MKIKPINWGEASSPDWTTCFYDNLKGKTPLGEYSIEWKSWKDDTRYYIYFNRNYISEGNDLNVAIVIATEHHENLVKSCMYVNDIKSNGS